MRRLLCIYFGYVRLYLLFKTTARLWVRNGHSSSKMYVDVILSIHGVKIQQVAICGHDSCSGYCCISEAK